MADTSTIASLATAGGTLILAIATFASTRSANRAARLSEQSLKAGLRPVLFNARPQDPPQKVGYGDDHWLMLRDGLAAVQESDGNVYLALPLRNVALGLAVLHGWHLSPRRAGIDDPHPEIDDFRTQTRDLYVPAATTRAGSVRSRASTASTWSRARARRTSSRGCGSAPSHVIGTWTAPILAEIVSQPATIHPSEAPWAARDASGSWPPEPRRMRAKPTASIAPATGPTR